MWIYFVLRSCWLAPIQYQKPQKYFRRKQGVLYPDNLFWRAVSPAKCLWWCFLGWMLQALQLCVQKFSGSHKAIQSSSALWLCFYKIIIFFFPFKIIPEVSFHENKWVQPLDLHQSLYLSDLCVRLSVFCTDLPWNSACLLSTVILPVLQEVLDSADACCEIMFVVICTLAF